MENPTLERSAEHPKRTTFWQVGFLMKSVDSEAHMHCAIY